MKSPLLVRIKRACVCELFPTLSKPYIYALHTCPRLYGKQLYHVIPRLTVFHLIDFCYYIILTLI